MRPAASATVVADRLSRPLNPPREDALRREPSASYERAAAAPAAPPAEQALVSAQLGRPARGENAVVHRCVYGLPTVVRVPPRLPDGTPFPTLFWLTCPVARSAVGRLEAEGEMRGMNDRLAEDPDLAAEYRAAHDRYIALRDRLGGPLEGDPGAGGMPDRVKCLHAHEAHHLATGDNPMGRRTHDLITPMPCPGPCVPEDLVADAYGGPPPPQALDGAWEEAAPPHQRPNRPAGADG